MRVALRNIVLSVGSLALLLFVLATIDGRVAKTIRSVRGVAGSPGALTAEGSVLGQIGSAVIDTVREESAAHAPLVMFTFVGGVLLLAMLRT